MEGPDDPLIFPENPSFADVLEAISDANGSRLAEFKVSVHEDEPGHSSLHFVNYRFCTPATFPPLEGSPREQYLAAVRRECRGLAFRVYDSGEEPELAARMFHKFFNVGERPDTAEHLLDLSRPHTLLVKHDGSLIAPVLLRSGEVRFATKSGFTTVADLMHERYLARHPHYAAFAKQWLTQGFTPLFEWCSLRNKIVLDYEEDALILLGIRNNATGRYLTHAQLEEAVKAFADGPIALTERITLDEGIESPADLMKSIKRRERIEGFVIMFEDSSELFKIKTDWYFARSNQKKAAESSLNSERGLWGLILNQEIDDHANLMDPLRLKAVQHFSPLLFDQVNALHGRLLALVEKYADASKKEFVLAFQANQDPDTMGPLALSLKVFDAHQAGEDTWEVVRDWCVKNTASNKGLEAMRPLFGGLAFSEKLGWQ